MKKKIYYLSGTHWDREWYQTFQGFRLHLESTMRELVDFLAQDNGFNVFYLDGQTIALEDFLQVCPHYAEKLKKVIASGKLKIGPWYCMPDEFNVSGEALLRNLALGFSMCEGYGVQPLRVGYICDIFGHIAQLPQLLRGFGLDCAVLGRGTNERTTEMFFNWRSPDGSAVTVYKVPDEYGYGSFAMEAAGQKRKNVERDAHGEEFKARAKAYVDREIRRGAGRAAICDMMDHEPLHKKTAEYIEVLRGMYPDCEIVHGGMEEMLAEAARSSLQQKTGELVETAPAFSPYLHLITNTLSSRYDIKKRNDACQNLLEKWLEPLSVFFAANDVELSPAYLHLAWKYLLQNHPHDSICGCSIDRVHQDMAYRFSQVESITAAVTEEKLLQANGQFELITAQGKSVLNIFGMALCERETFVTVQLPFEPGYPFYQEPFGYEKLNRFYLVDGEGNNVPYRIEKILRGASLRTVSEQCEKADIYTVTFKTRLLPLGVTRLEVVAAQTPTRGRGAVADAEGNLENQFLRADILPDGRIRLTDKKSGNVYDGLMGFCDDGELGDGWWSVRGKTGETAVKTRLMGVEILANAGNGASVATVRAMTVPLKMEYGERGVSRSAEKTELVFRTTLTLNEGEDFLRVALHIDNNARDHRVRMHLPTDTQSKTYRASQSFCFVERRVGIDESTLDYKEPDQPEKNMRGIAYRRDKSRGLALIAKGGINEISAPDDGRASLLPTLYRCFSKTHTTNGEPDGQLQGSLTFDFSIKPLNGESDTQLFELQNMLVSPVFTMVTHKDLPFKSAPLAVEGGAVVSALKPSDDGRACVLRVFNAESARSELRVRLENPAAKVFLSDNLERKVEPLMPAGGRLLYTLEPHKIVTFRIENLT